MALGGKSRPSSTTTFQDDAKVSMHRSCRFVSSVDVFASGNRTDSAKRSCWAATKDNFGKSSSEVSSRKTVGSIVAIRSNDTTPMQVARNRVDLKLFSRKTSIQNRSHAVCNKRVGRPNSADVPSAVISSKHLRTAKRRISSSSNTRACL